MPPLELPRAPPLVSAGFFQYSVGDAVAKMVTRSCGARNELSILRWRCSRCRACTRCVWRLLSILRWRCYPMLYVVDRAGDRSDAFNTPLEMLALIASVTSSGSRRRFQYSVGDAPYPLTGVEYCGSQGNFQYSVGDARRSPRARGKRQLRPFNTPLEMHIRRVAEEGGRSNHLSILRWRCIRVLNRYPKTEELFFQYSVGDACRECGTVARPLYALSILRWRCRLST